MTKPLLFTEQHKKVYDREVINDVVKDYIVCLNELY